ncbi:MAG: glycosyltransferase family 4 protein [Planctomycetia bacterium]|nr:glycosyltransferase family 4 protein [Planctomycetia bacterium]
MSGNATVVYFTAGAAGMFCGSCLRDNAVVGELQRQGCDVLLAPLYTPIRTDERDVSIQRVFYGGINVYLQEKLPAFRFVPRLFTRWLDRPWVLNRLAAKQVNVDARELGGLTVDMLAGEHGRLRGELERMLDWLADDVRPALVNLTNLLIGACAPEIKRRLGIPVLVTLQGDDLFLDELIEPHRSQARDAVRRLAQHVDGFITFSDFYADFMADYLAVPRERFHLAPLGVHWQPYVRNDAPAPRRPPTIGYFARIAPEKGFHLLIDAFVELARRPGMEQVRLRAAGWLSAKDRAFYQQQLARLDKAQLRDRFQYDGVVDLDGKVRFLHSIDLLSVPTVYREPKGLFVLEALAAGVPVVLPAHGAFPELIAQTGGGRLVAPGDVNAFADAWEAVLKQPEERVALGSEAQRRVQANHGIEVAAQRTRDVFRKFAAV